MAREVDDIRSAINDIRARAATFRLDPNRLAGLGASAGAHLIMQAAVADHAPLYAVVGWSGPYDLTQQFVGANVARTQRDHLNRAVGEVLNCGLDPVRCRAAAAAMSPALRVTANRPPVLLFNSARELVAVGQLTEFAARLRARGVVVETRILQGTRHAEAYHASAIEPTLQFLDRYR
jgi:acetyl esterase/lipase